MKKPNQLNVVMLSVITVIWAVLAPAGVFAATLECATHAATNDYQELGINSGRLSLAQEFTVTSPCYLTAAAVLQAKTGTITDNAWLYVASDNAGEPAPGSLDVGSTLAVPGGSFAWATSTFSGGVLLSPATNYWLVYTFDGTPSGSNYREWAVFDSGSSFFKSDGASWTSIASTQGTFQIEGSDSSPVTPSIGGATSTVDQAESNLASSVYIFLASLMLMVWLVRKH